jgi:hypothetical protein
VVRPTAGATRSACRSSLIIWRAILLGRSLRPRA